MIMKQIIIFILGICTVACSSPTGTPSVLHIKVTLPSQACNTSLFRMGKAVNQAGEALEMNAQNMFRNGKPVLPVMGEIHFSRYPDAEWRKELLKMKAGGIDLIATYLFWIHHEEMEGQYDWSGQRNLRQFIQLCRELNLPVVLRIGPWSHGEARNGGFPEWLVNSGCTLRSQDPEYLKAVNRWYQNIYQQIQGQLWKDGGPVAGIQLENEYAGAWEHLTTLKKMAMEIGFDVPLYTRTGWPDLATPATFGEIIPLFGGYVDGFWDRELEEMPGGYGEAFIFQSFRASHAVASEQAPKEPDKESACERVYPYFTCEMGGGMMTSYHRRINIAPMDVFASTLVQLGSGSNMPGYYMYHGGAHPDGLLTGMNEQQASNYCFANDLPVKTYDFQAPLGEFGQINEHYRLLRRMHLFLRDFGHELALMSPSFPAGTPIKSEDNASLRWCVRSNGHSGYIFVNNYHRLKTLTEKKNIQFDIELTRTSVRFPSIPVDIPSNSCFFWPFNLQIEGVTLLYATAQPIAKITENNVTTVIFTENAGIPVEFMFANDGIRVKSSRPKVIKQDNQLLFAHVKPGTDVAIQLEDTQKREVRIVLLDEVNSLNFWKDGRAGQERFFLTRSGLVYDDDYLQLDTDGNDQTVVSIFPAPSSLTFGDVTLKGSREGIFTRYTIRRPTPEPVIVQLQPVREAGSVRMTGMGKAHVAEQPKDADFEQSAIWKVLLPKDIDPARDIYLRFPYVGDVARIYLDNRLLTDNFYNGKPFEIGLKRFAPEIYRKELTIRILPLQKDVPVYFPQTALPDFAGANSYLSLPSVEVYEKTPMVLHINNKNTVL